MTQAYKPTEEMLAILAEIEADPRSRLFRAPIQLGAPPNFDVATTGREPFLSLAERKLVGSFREELACHLYHRGQELVASSPWGQATLLDASKKVGEAQSKGSDPVRGADLLNKLSRLTGQERSELQAQGDLNALQCLQSANRLIAKESTSVLMGFVQIGEGQIRSAVSRFGSVLANGRRDDVKPFAAQNLALAYWEAGSMGDAAQSYLWALQLSPESGEYALFALVTSALAGRWEDVTRLTKRLADLGITADHALVSDVAQLCARRDARGIAGKYRANLERWCLQGPLAEAVSLPYRGPDKGKEQ